MKKCPYCKADIEDDARFCLYCMTSLDEKEKIPEPKYKNKRRWLAIPAALLALILIGGGFGFIVSRKAPADTADGNFPGGGTVSAEAPPGTSFPHGRMRAAGTPEVRRTMRPAAALGLPLASFRPAEVQACTPAAQRPTVRKPRRRVRAFPPQPPARRPAGRAAAGTAPKIP